MFLWSFRPLTRGCWRDVVRMFGDRGEPAKCWCMWWRQSPGNYRALGKIGRKRKLSRFVARGNTLGIQAYFGDEPIGWCSVAPRKTYPRFSHSRTLKPIDDASVWSVVCFVTAPGYRRRGVSSRLLRAAVAYAKAKGARIVEGYPTELHKAPSSWISQYYMEFASTFRKAGFVEVARPTPTRRIMRYLIRPVREARCVMGTSGR